MGTFRVRSGIEHGKANFKPKPNMEVTGNRQVARVNPIFFTIYHAPIVAKSPITLLKEEISVHFEKFSQLLGVSFANRPLPIDYVGDIASGLKNPH